ncbi:hypothetical protein Q9L58_008339 [Maublancomyces gigas]|uniref:Uncharacterized protein n=1 Tax=Discina gigas TaxID=1032678 RepID=A0ABR3GA21_9PEZI
MEEVVRVWKEFEKVRYELEIVPDGDREREEEEDNWGHGELEQEELEQAERRGREKPLFVPFRYLPAPGVSASPDVLSYPTLKLDGLTYSAVAELQFFSTRSLSFAKVVILNYDGDSQTLFISCPDSVHEVTSGFPVLRNSPGKVERSHGLVNFKGP